MSRTKNYLQRKALERVPAPALDLVGKAVLKAVDRAVEERWSKALELAAEAEGSTVEQKVASVTKRFRRELTTVGAASGAVAAAPGIGTSAAAGALVADIGWFAMRSTDLIMTIGAVYGHTESTAEERRAWVLAILAFGEDAAEQFGHLVSQLDAEWSRTGERLTTRLAGLAGGDAATLDALRRINTNLAGRVVTKYGSRRTLISVGKLLPFGIGAVVGGTASYGMVRAVAGQATRFFTGYQAMLPPPPGADSVRYPPPLSAEERRRSSIPVSGHPKSGTNGSGS